VTILLLLVACQGNTSLANLGVDTVFVDFERTDPTIGGKVTTAIFSWPARGEACAVAKDLTVTLGGEEMEGDGTGVGGIRDGVQDLVITDGGTRITFKIVAPFAPRFVTPKVSLDDWRQGTTVEFAPSDGLTVISARAKYRGRVKWGLFHELPARLEGSVVTVAVPAETPPGDYMLHLETTTNLMPTCPVRICTAEAHSQFAHRFTVTE
jgi:hypothetical protein